MKHTLFVALSLLLLGGCAGIRETTRNKVANKLTAEIWKEDPVEPDSISGYLPNPEVNLRDALIRKYPTDLKKPQPVRVDTLRLPGEKVYIRLPGRVDTVFSTARTDSLLSQFAAMALKIKEYSELQDAFAKLQSRLLQIYPPNGRHESGVAKGPQEIVTKAADTKPRHGRPTPNPPPPAAGWRDEWYWRFWVAVVVLGGLSAHLLYLRFRDAKPATR